MSPLPFQTSFLIFRLRTSQALSKLRTLKCAVLRSRDVKMVFFLSLRESTARPGTIEPDILPFSSAASQTSTTRLVSSNPSITSTFREYITTWDTSDAPALFRRIICILAFFLHLPLNIISILSYGLSLGLFLGIVFSVLNLLCLGLALWKLDVMRGQRLFYNWM